MAFEMLILKTDKAITANRILTERETEVLSLCADGLSNKEIAAQLYITPDTIDTHCRNIAAKLNARNIKQAIAIAIRNGVIK